MPVIIFGRLKKKMNNNSKLTPRPPWNAAPQACPRSLPGMMWGFCALHDWQVYVGVLPPDQPIGKGAINWPAKTEPSRCIVVGGDPSWDPSWDTHIIYNNIKEGRTLKIPVPMPKRYHGRRDGPPAKSCEFHACKYCRVQLEDC